MVQLAKISLLALTLGSLASPASAVCEDLRATQKAFPTKPSLIVHVSEAQYHFLQGVYAGSPLTPNGLPPGDGAIVFEFSQPIQIMGGTPLDTIIVWTDGMMSCGTVTVSHELIDLMKQVKDNVGDGKEL